MKSRDACSAPTMRDQPNQRTTMAAELIVSNAPTKPWPKRKKSTARKGPPLSYDPDDPRQLPLVFEFKSYQDQKEETTNE
jgi:hypothetical protein